MPLCAQARLDRRARGERECIGRRADSRLPPILAPAELRQLRFGDRYLCLAVPLGGRNAPDFLTGVTPLGRSLCLEVCDLRPQLLEGGEHVAIQQLWQRILPSPALEVGDLGLDAAKLVG